MDVLVFGATGMVGQAVLRECLRAPDVRRVVAVGRTASPVSDPRLTNIVTPDIANLWAVAPQLSVFDACFFCLGVSSVGMSEPEYTRLTYDLTLGAARTLAYVNPALTFVYVSGAGTDSTEQGKLMWARVKGRTENALMKEAFKAAYMFRPGLIQPLHAVRSRTALYRLAYLVATPIFGLLRAVAPRSFVTSEELGQAMLGVARAGYPRAVLEVRDIKAAALIPATAPGPAEPGQTARS